MIRTAQSHNKYYSAGFSLLEILVALVILGVMAALIISGVDRARSRADLTHCMANLRNSGIGMFAYIGDSDNRIRSFYGGSYMEGLIWSRVMFEQGYVADEDLLRCPIGELTYLNDPSKRHLWYWQTYGINLTTPPGRVDVHNSSSGSTGRVHETSMHAIERPDLYLLLADSTDPAAQPKQIFRMAPANKGGIHLRHEGKASVFYLDGRVETIDRDGLRELYVRSQLMGYRPLPIYP